MSATAGEPRVDAEGAWRAARAPLAVFGLALAVHGLVQLALRGFVDRDAWFHGRYSELIFRGQIPWQGTEFPWLTQNAISDNAMDWSLLWHLLVAPFAGTLGPVTGLRVFAAVQAALLTTAFFVLLRRQQVRAPLAWTAVLIASSPEWLFRLHFARPTPLVLASLLVILDLVLRRRDVLAACAIAASLLVYEVPAPVALTVGAAWVGRSIDLRRPDWPALVPLAAGLVAGVLLHPGFWQGGTFHVWSLMAGSLRVAAAGGQVDLGNGYELVLSFPRELGQPGVRGMLVELWFPLVATGAAWVTVWRCRRRGAAVAGWLLATAGLCATWRSGRFYEYWQVLAVLGAAMALSGPDARGSRRTHKRLIGVTAIILGVLCVRGFLPLLSPRLRDGGAAVAPAIAAIHETSRPGDVVWHLSWDDFAPLFHFAPDLRFTQGMDPWWCVARDPEAALAHALAASGALGGDALREVLISRFRARYVVLWSQPEDGADGVRRRERVAALLDAAPWATCIYRDEATTAYALRRP